MPPGLRLRPSQWLHDNARSIETVVSQVETAHDLAAAVGIINVAGQIPLTCNEIAALFNTLIIEPSHRTRHRLQWSAWRRHCQHRARTCHYQRQASQP